MKIAENDPVWLNDCSSDVLSNVSESDVVVSQRKHVHSRQVELVEVWLRFGRLLLVQYEEADEE